MSTERLHIRHAMHADIAAMVALETAPDARRYLGIVGRQFHESALANPDQEQLVAELGGKVVGFAVLAGIRDGGGRLELRRIIMGGDHRGCGYGRLLFRAAVARAYQCHGAKQVWLDAKPDNTVALTLYASEGFVRNGTVPDPVDPDGLLVVLVHTPSAASVFTKGNESHEREAGAYRAGPY